MFGVLENLQYATDTFILQRASATCDRLRLESEQATTPFTNTRC